jgi:RNA polymerase sigma-70 factor (ECF subfamily)
MPLTGTDREDDVEPARPIATDALAALARSASAGDAKAVRTLIVSVTPATLKTVRGILGTQHPDVEDTTQDSIWRFVSSLGGFRYECSVLHFACKIAVHTALNVRRRDRVHGERRIDALVPEQLASDDPSPAEALGAAARRQALRELFAMLPDAQAEAFLLHIVVGLTVEETADACGVPANTVRSRLRLGKQALRMRAGAIPAFEDAVKGVEE